jgi:hypothetical protein
VAKPARWRPSSPRSVRSRSSSTYHSAIMLLNHNVGGAGQDHLAREERNIGDPEQLGQLEPALPAKLGARRDRAVVIGGAARRRPLIAAYSTAGSTPQTSSPSTYTVIRSHSMKAAEPVNEWSLDCV